MREKWPNDPNLDFWPEGYNLEDSIQFENFRSLYLPNEEGGKSERNLHISAVPGI